MDTPRSSCERCKQPLPAGVESGLCVECSGTHASSGTLSRVVSGVVSRVRNVFRLLRKRLGLTPRETPPRPDEAVTKTLPAGQGRSPASPTGAVTKSAPPQVADASTGSIHVSDAMRAFGLPSTNDYSNDIDNVSTVDPPSRPPLPMPPHPPNYELVGEINRGGMGVVYLAFERAAPDQLVAIKYLMDSADVSTFKRFQGEMRLARLKSENVARILTSSADAGRPYIVMELAGGGTLAGRVKDGGPLDPWLAARWVRDVALAVAEAHERHIIHRDIKPGNILLARRDKDDADYVRLHGQPKADAPFRPDDYLPKLTDFGLAKRLGGSTGVTVGSAAMGTAPYMPPEQVKNPQAGDEDERVGVRSDVYSLGATLYHLVCGRAPFSGESPAAVMLDVLHREPPLPRKLRPELPWQLEAIIVKAMEKKPRNRYQTAQAMADDLRAFCDKKEIQARRMTRARRALRTVKRNALGILVVCGLLAAGVPGIWLTSGNAKSGPVVEPERDPELEARAELTTIQREIQVNGESELIAPTGYPRLQKWAVGRGNLVPSEARDQTVDFHAHGLAFLELLPDPGCDRYRVIATLRHVHANPFGGVIGVYAGHGTAVSPTGHRVHHTVAAKYSDFYSRDEMNDPDEADRHGIDFITGIVLERVGQVPVFQTETNWKRVKFKPDEELKRPWRIVTFEVTPAQTELYWGDPQPKNRVWGLGGVQLSNLRSQLQRETLNKLEMPPPILPAWTQRSPLGLWVNGSVASFKSVRVQRLPNP